MNNPANEKEPHIHIDLDFEGYFFLEFAKKVLASLVSLSFLVSTRVEQWHIDNGALVLASGVFGVSLLLQLGLGCDLGY